MASLQSLQTGELLKRTKVFANTTITVMPAMQIQHCGPELFAKVTVAVTTGDITLKADDVDGETTTVLTVDVSDAAYDTFLEIENAINATGVFRCSLIGALPSDTSTAMLATLAATSCRTDNGLTLYFLATTTSQVFGFAITNNKFTARPTGGFSTQKNNWTTDELCENMINYLEILLTCTNGGTTTIYAVDDVNDVETAMWSDAFVSATKETHGSTEPSELFIKAPEGCRLVVQFAASTSTDDFSVPNIKCIGTTKHQVGDEVPGANYTGIA